MTKILNDKEVEFWSSFSSWASMLDMVGLGFINKWRFLRFLRRNGYEGDYCLVNSMIRYPSSCMFEIRTVLCRPHSLEYVATHPCSVLQLEKVGNFDGAEVSFVEMKDSNKIEIGENFGNFTDGKGCKCQKSKLKELISSEIQKSKVS